MWELPFLEVLIILHEETLQSLTQIGRFYYSEQGRTRTTVLSIPLPMLFNSAFRRKLLWLILAGVYLEDTVLSFKGQRPEARKD